MFHNDRSELDKHHIYPIVNARHNFTRLVGAWTVSQTTEMTQVICQSERIKKAIMT